MSDNEENFDTPVETQEIEVNENDENEREEQTPLGLSGEEMEEEGEGEETVEENEGTEEDGAEEEDGEEEDEEEQNEGGEEEGEEEEEDDDEEKEIKEEGGDQDEGDGGQMLVPRGVTKDSIYSFQNENQMPIVDADGWDSGHDDRGTQLSLDNTDDKAMVIFQVDENLPPVERMRPVTEEIGQMRHIVAEALGVDEEEVRLLFNGITLPDESTLKELGIDEGEMVALEVQLSPDARAAFMGRVAKETTNISENPTELLAMSPTATEHFDKVTLQIEIERPRFRKPFLGGYRHKVTGVEYHHASAQTQTPVRVINTAQQQNNATQTVQQRNQKSQNCTSTATQVPRPGLHISTAQNKIIIPGKYETAEEFQAKRTAQTITLQKYCRRWLAQKQISQMRQLREARLEWENEEQTRKLLQKQERIRREFERRTNPKSKRDFDLLYNALEKWRADELTKINETMHGADRKSALYMLLAKETELLHAIHRHQVNVSEENKEALVHRLLSQAAAPKTWTDAQGNTISMDTPYSIRSRELLEIHASLCLRYLSQDERLDVLLTLKHTVKSHNCPLTMELVSLIDREVDLTMRGVNDANLAGLRKRIANLFLQYCKTPTFNPEVARHLKVPQDVSRLRQDVHYCKSCGRYLQGTEFPLASTATVLGICKKCRRGDNLARQRQDFSIFHTMLNAMRMQEKAYDEMASISLLVEEADIRYLVENIWESMSILSSWRDLHDLVLCRWRREEEWAPWNCVLFTKDEAEAHFRLSSLQEGYADMLIQRVQQKHVLARNHFAQLRALVLSQSRGHKSRTSSGARSTNSSTAASNKRDVQLQNINISGTVVPSASKKKSTAALMG